MNVSGFLPTESPEVVAFCVHPCSQIRMRAYQTSFSNSDRKLIQESGHISFRRGTLVLSVVALLFCSQTLAASSVIFRAVIKQDTKQLLGLDRATLQADGLLKQQINLLFAALNHRDLDAIKSQISPSRIYVEISDKTGAYLTNTQTLAVMEAFLHSHTSLSAKFEFDSAEGDNGSASGLLTAKRDGHTYTYRLNFGFTRNLRGSWLLTRISMR